MSDSNDGTVTRSVIDQIKTDRTDNSKGKVIKLIHTHEVSEMKEITSKIIDYPRLFLLRMRDHHLSQVIPFALGHNLLDLRHHLLIYPTSKE